MVAGYLRARKLRPLWYQMDEGDRDLATFFHYMGLAARHAAPRYRRPLPHLTPEYLQGLPTFTRRFFEELSQRLRTASLLVLDNYQEVSPDALFHEMVALGVEAASAGIGVMIMSRELPPPAFARLQAAQIISFIDEEDLRLTKTEARAVVRLHTGSNKLPRLAQIDTLQNKFHGWVAGFVLILEQVKTVRADQIAADQQTPQVIFDYLAREVMRRLSPETQRFLLRTAFLPNMTAAMATRLSEEASAGDMLARLYQSRSFTERRAGVESLYQYHPLFREFLRAQARAVLRPDQVADIQRAAASLLEEAERVEDAVALYAEAGQIQEIVRLVMARGPELLQQGRSQTLESWLTQVPAGLYEQEPWLFYWLASCRLVTAPLESEAIFEKAFERFKAQDNMAGMLLSWAGIISSIQFSWIDLSRFDRWIDIMLKMVQPGAAFPSTEIDIQFTFCMVNALMWRRPYASVVVPWIDRAKNLLEGVPGIETYSPLVAQMSNFCAWLGDLDAADKYAKILKSAAECETNLPLMRLTYYANTTPLAWLRGHPKETLRLVQEGLAISEKTGVYVFDSALLAAGFYGSLFLNELSSAEHYLKRSACLVEHPAHVMRANFLLMQAWMLRIKGDLSKAWGLLQAGLEVRGLHGSPYPEALLSCAAAELLHGLGEEERADQYLSHALRIAKGMGSRVLQFMGNLFQSQFAFDRDRREEALSALREALAVGKQSGFSFFAWFVPENVARLCAKALEAEIETEYVQELIRITRLAPTEESVWLPEAWPWPVKIYTLGRFEIHLDGIPLAPRRKAPYRVLHLLKLLIALGAKDVSISRLVDTLWPEAEGDTGQETFSKTVQRLRRLLASEQVIQVRDGKVSLNRALCWTDVLVFEELAKETALSRGQLDGLVPLYERLIELYRGPFLGEDEVEGWADDRRRAARERFIQAVDGLSASYREAGQAEQALSCLEKALDVDPFAELLYGRLIQLFQSLSRPAEAKSVWVRYRRHVVERAGRDPSEAMQRLAKTLV
ncbi:BTAD domain-containing putative transcriptional regulator [Nitrospira moscoviensis]|uniref:BTAD domain-containing putative transcriptional regulator n=1 Tax=Nitrospira moscoviensis TaxID=42253 RepID=UPI0006A7DC1A|nr:BTAD domain-containing putative transcriptional regulator [Nitrospira moscoviensis]